MNIVMMGPPGSGKSTQAELLAEKLGVRHISTGALYRHIAQEDSPLGRKVKAALDVGDLVDDETTYELVDKHLNKIPGGFVVDGYPRTLAQAKKEPFTVDKVIYLDLPDAEAVKRLVSRGREGETSEVITERLLVYHQATQPILQYYRDQNKLLEIDGRPTIEEVQKELMQKLHD